MQRAALFLILFLWFGFGYGQKQKHFADSISKKNLIKFNLTAPLLFGSGNYVLEYERVLKNNQSFSFSAGVRRLPKLVSLGLQDSAFMVRSHKSTQGFSMSADYRFYFKNRNKRNAPDGIYIGPYIDYFNVDFTNNIEVYENNVLDNQVEINSQLSVASLGFQVGYQFIIRNRFAVDMIFIGPSISKYKAKLQLSGALKPIEGNEYYEQIKEKLLEKYPLLEGALDGAVVEQSGSFNATQFGYRYVIKIGYAF